MKHGFMARIGKDNGHHPWASRDYEEESCRAANCRWNRADQCMVPSRCEINTDGSCAGFEPPPKPAPISHILRCRICGGEVRLASVNVYRQPTWEHVGEKLSHPAEPR